MGAQPKNKPVDPQPLVEEILAKPSPKEEYNLGSTYLLHFTTSKGQIAAWVKPQAKSPPNIHLA